MAILHTFVQYLLAYCSRAEAAIDVICGTFVGPSVPDKFVECRDPCSNHARENETILFQFVAKLEYLVTPYLVRLQRRIFWMSV